MKLRQVITPLVFSVCFGVVTWSGCGDDGGSGGGGGDGGGGGSTSTTTSTTVTSTTSSTVTTGSGGAGGSSSCFNGAPDDECDLLEEDCSCADCLPTALCNEDQCVDDGSCDDFDSCTCPDCDLNYYCGDPADFNCETDGVCDSFFEGCGCPDCYDHASCVDNSAACNGGAPDEVCDTGEDCACGDCLGTVACAPCAVDGTCDFDDPCTCADCDAEPFCTDPDQCLDDGICAPLYEGCQCTDCMAEPDCTP